METDILAKIPDKKLVQVFLPLINTDEKYRVLGIYHKSSPPFFSLYFKPGVLPIDSIDTKSLCLINVDQGIPTVTLESRINTIDNSQHLGMTLLRSINHEQVRESFRVTTVTSVIARPLESHQSKDEEDCFFMGETVDLSGSGILASFMKKPPIKNQVLLEIQLRNDNDENIKAIAHPVRTVKVSDKQYDIAFHFDDISREDREMIISYCLVIQRNHFRSKRKVKEL